MAPNTLHLRPGVQLETQDKATIKGWHKSCPTLCSVFLSSSQSSLRQRGLGMERNLGTHYKFILSCPAAISRASKQFLNIATHLSVRGAVVIDKTCWALEDARVRIVGKYDGGKTCMISVIVRSNQSDELIYVLVGPQHLETDRHPRHDYNTPVLTSNPNITTHGRCGLQKLINTRTELSYEPAGDQISKISHSWNTTAHIGPREINEDGVDPSRIGEIGMIGINPSRTRAIAITSQEETRGVSKAGENNSGGNKYMRSNEDAMRQAMRQVHHVEECIKGEEREHMERWMDREKSDTHEGHTRRALASDVQETRTGGSEHRAKLSCARVLDMDIDIVFAWVPMRNGACMRRREVKRNEGDARRDEARSGDDVIGTRSGRDDSGLLHEGSGWREELWEYQTWFAGLSEYQVLQENGPEGIQMNRRGLTSAG
ncbi:hypothetical protein B0H16DRAFT_1480037 [Mycena metata]|uniref:Uncharacterized protein n=1 Tax=Mycena metata TaxID=1033252 RepID=A0AAD7H4J4_9AGAR|nr:hypothetical protein B0H16DRAFT_1480037 [Mycena metata]